MSVIVFQLKMNQNGGPCSVRRFRIYVGSGIRRCALNKNTVMISYLVHNTNVSDPVFSERWRDSCCSGHNKSSKSWHPKLLADAKSIYVALHLVHTHLKTSCDQWLFVSWCNLWRRLYGLYSSEVKGKKGQRTSNWAWTRDLCSIGEFPRYTNTSTLLS